MTRPLSLACRRRTTKSGGNTSTNSTASHPSSSNAGSARLGSSLYSLSELFSLKGCVPRFLPVLGEQTDALTVVHRCVSLPCAVACSLKDMVNQYAVRDFPRFSFHFGCRLMFVLDAHAIYLLNLLLAFLQPRFDPSLQEDLAADELEGGGADDGPVLPSQRDDEFRPFVRRLPEWQFWCVRAILQSYTRTNSLFQAIGYAGDADRPVLHDQRGVRRAGFLANPRRLLLCALHPHYAQANPVRACSLFSCASLLSPSLLLSPLHRSSLLLLHCRHQPLRPRSLAPFPSVPPVYPTKSAASRHMIKYKYVPFDLGRKARYGGPSK
jgi:hypothetical protein